MEYSKFLRFLLRYLTFSSFIIYIVVDSSRIKIPTIEDLVSHVPNSYQGEMTRVSCNKKVWKCFFLCYQLWSVGYFQLFCTVGNQKSNSSTFSPKISYMCVWQYYYRLYLELNELHRNNNIYMLHMSLELCHGKNNIQWTLHNSNSHEKIGNNLICLRGIKNIILKNDFDGFVCWYSIRVNVRIIEFSKDSVCNVYIKRKEI